MALAPHCSYLHPSTHSFEPSAVCWDSFLLNHSPQYHFAVGAAVVEYLLEAGAPIKFGPLGEMLSAVGLLLVCGGQALRSVAMWTAGSNFTHLVADSQREGHVLVESGVYRYLRHPSYTGWFWWSVGTQLLLRNPICAVAYAVAARGFFRSRIAHEEATLRVFFGDAYEAYVRRTWVGIPGL